MKFRQLQCLFYCVFIILIKVLFFLLVVFWMIVVVF